MKEEERTRRRETLLLASLAKTYHASLELVLSILELFSNRTPFTAYRSLGVVQSAAQVYVIELLAMISSWLVTHNNHGTHFKSSCRGLIKNNVCQREIMPVLGAEDGREACCDRLLYC